MMKILKKKKSVKGMTLIEVIVAIAVLGIMAMFAARMATVSCNIMKSTTHLNNKTEIEAPYAAARPDDSTALEGDVAISISSGSFATINYTASKYDTSVHAGDEAADGKQPMNGDLYYYANIHE